ncbi:MAG: hypothetical protein ACRD1X_17035, partial [Vicinamibacteria bacterium]
FGEAKPKPCEGWRRGPDEALAKSDAPLAQAARIFLGLLMNDSKGLKDPEGPASLPISAT